MQRTGVVAIFLAVVAPIAVSAQVPPSRLATATPIGGGARVDYSTVNSLIAFDQTGSDGYYDVYTMTAAGGSTKTCLTCGAPIPQANNGNPAWSPTAQYILFQSQDPTLAIPPQLLPIANRVTQPGYGTNNNLWLMTSDAKSFWQLTQVQSGQGVLHAQWSHSGTRIAWANKIASTVPVGQWNIQVADLVWNNGVPSLANAQTLAPFGIDFFYETHQFSPDDSQLLFSGGNPSLDIMDIYLVNIANGMPTNLTNTPTVWEEHAHYTPDGTKIVYGSAMNINNTRNYFVPFTDYWVMNADGTSPQRLTYFNTPGYPEYYPFGLVCADFAYGPSPQWIISSLEENQLPPPGSLMQYVINVLKLKSATTPTP